MKQLLIAGLCAAGLFTSCLGPNRAHDSITNWNANLSEQHWVGEVVFIGFHIIPVYQFAYLGDIVIFNTMGYWGENPLKDPGAFPEDFHSKKD
ncbi:MAG: DUF3332 family protein [Planctomycetes bacterium]|nr:DUF3332 family protein [Planctomycetota bacterium]MCB9903437.1 DUF3332 family protein [Planctomycetota bacterium]